jgi:hypothetical protein
VQQVYRGGGESALLLDFAIEHQHALEVPKAVWERLERFRLHPRLRDFRVAFPMEPVGFHGERRACHAVGVGARGDGHLKRRLHAVAEEDFDRVLAGLGHVDLPGGLSAHGPLFDLRAVVVIDPCAQVVGIVPIRGHEHGDVLGFYDVVGHEGSGVKWGREADTENEGSRSAERLIGGRGLEADPPLRCGPGQRTEGLKFCTFFMWCSAKVSSLPARSREHPIASRQNAPIFFKGDGRSSMALVRRLHFPIVEFHHAVVGSERGSEGRLESDYLAHVNLVVGRGSGSLCGQLMRIRLPVCL